MTDKPIGNARPVGGDYFVLGYNRRSKYNLYYYLLKFRVDDYWIYKCSNKFRCVKIEDLMNFKYAGYILFKKDIYSKEHIENWVSYLHSVNRDSFIYLARPFPPFNPEDKIVIKK